MIKIKKKNNESHPLQASLALRHEVTKEWGGLLKEEVWAGTFAAVEGDLLSQYFRAEWGGALRSPLLMDGGGWVWEEGWKGGSGSYRAPRQKEMHAGKLASLEGGKG